MKFIAKIMSCFLGLSLIAGDVSAQRKLPCPKPGKHKNYYAPRLINYSQANGFITYPVAYKYKGGFDRTYVRPSPSLGFAINIQNYLVLTDRFELFVEAMYAMTEHGIKFQYQNNGASSSGRDYVVSTQYRFSLGAAVNLNPPWTIAVAPSVVNNSMIAFGSSSYSSTNGNGSISANANWNNGMRDKWYAGASFYARWNVWKRAYLSLISAIDFETSAHQEGTMTVFDNGIPQEYRIQKYPYLLHIGMGVGFRFLEIENRRY